MEFPHKQFIAKKPFVLLFIILSILIVIGGWITFRQTVDRVRIARHNELKAIANFKTGQIVNWLEERRSDAMALSRSPLFSEAVNEWIVFRDDPHLQRRVVDRLTVFREQYDYADIVLTTPRGEILLAFTVQDQCLAPVTIARIIAASQSQAVTFTDFYYCEMHDRIQLDFIANIRDPAGQTIAALILRTLPEEFLYPLIESWPLPSKTAETLLVRRTVAGDSLVFLNNLRHFLLLILFLLIVVSTSIVLIYHRRQRDMFSALYADEKERHAMEEQFRTTLYSIGDAVIVTDKNGMVKYLNPVAENLTGWQEKEAKGKSVRKIFQIIEEESRQEVESPVQKVIREGSVQGLANHTLLLTRDGREIPIADSGAPIRTEDGEILGVVLVFRDQSVERAARRALQASEEKFRTLIDQAAEMVFYHDLDGKIIEANQAVIKCLGYSKGELLALNIMDIDPFARERDDMSKRWKVIKPGDPAITFEAVHRKKDGSTYPVEVTISKVILPEGEFILGMARDITERKRAEAEIRLDEERLESLLRINQHPAASIQGLLDFTLNEAIKLTGSKIGYIYFYNEERKEFSLNTWSNDVMKECTVANPQRVYQLDKTGIWGEAVRQRRPIVVNDFAAANPVKKGTPKGHVQLHTFLTIPVFSDSRIVAVVDVANKETDYNESDIRQLNLMMDAVWKIVQRKQAEDTLKTNFTLLKLAGETAKFGGWQIDLSENRVVWSEEVAAIHEVPVGYAPTVSEVFHYYAPEWQDKILEVFNRCVEEGVAYDEEMEIITARGRRVWVRTTGEALIDDTGKIVKIQGSFQDISERKQMEANLKASEEQLRQTQKMEALGRLASGIAHDFNNILSIILGHTSLLKMDQRTPERVQHSIATIEKAGQRGAELVKRLLTLARKSEPEAKPLQLSEIVADTVKLLQETFPKTIVFETDVDPRLPLIMADASQIQQVLMNLSVNARDAMPKGGTLSFYAEREAGQRLRQRHPDAIAAEYVKLCVRDTGVGMNKATTERIFEPFYTTKEQGQGTGLGLATVHGIIRNHNGFIEVESEPAAGTTFSIYLPVPVTQEILDLAGAEIDAAVPETTGGNETILLIEDEESIIEMLTTVFQSQGYQVIVAMDGQTGVEKYNQSQDDIDLVISDMGLPHLTGEEVFYRIRKINPDARVVIASGFVDPQRKSELYKAGLARFIQKPYFPMDILKVVREILDEAQNA